MTQNSQSTQLDQLLALSARDTQFLVASNALVSLVLNDQATNEQIEHNFEALTILFAFYYSASEANALATRLKALLPARTPITLVRPAAVSNSTLVS